MYGGVMPALSPGSPSGRLHGPQLNQHTGTVRVDPMLGDLVLVDTHDIGRADGHPVPGCGDTHQLIPVSAAHDDSRRYPIPFGDLILDLVGDVRERGNEGAEETDSGPAIHLRIAVEVEPVVGGEQGRDPVKVLVVECREEASDYGLVLLE